MAFVFKITDPTNGHFEVLNDESPGSNVLHGQWTDRSTGIVNGVVSGGYSAPLVVLLTLDNGQVARYEQSMVAGQLDFIEFI
jgi:hypothetical protein